MIFWDTLYQNFFDQYKANMLLINIKWFLKLFYRAHRSIHNFHRETWYMTDFVLGYFHKVIYNKVALGV